MSAATSGLIVEIDRTNPPLAVTPTWTNITSRVRSVTVERGRSDPHDRFPAGRISVEVDNQGRAFDRTNTTGPYYGTHFDVGMRIRVRDTVHSQTIAQGWVEDWPMAWNRDAGTVTLHAADALQLLAAADIYLERGSQESPQARISWIYGAAYGDYTSYLIGSHDFGQCLVQPMIVKGNALDAVQLVAESDGGVLFGSKTGTTIFYDRHAPFTYTRQNTSQWTFSPSGAGGTVPYSWPWVGGRRALLTNRAIIQRAGAADLPAQADDTTSQTNYGVRSRSRTDLVHTSVTDSQSIAETIVQAWSTPQEPAIITLHPVSTAEAAYEAIVKLDLRDLVTLEWAPGNAAPRNSSAMTVEHISIAADATSLRATLGLAPARLQAMPASSTWLKADSSGQANSTRRAAP